MPPRRRNLKKKSNYASGILKAYDRGVAHRQGYMSRPLYTFAKDVAHLKGLLNTEFKRIDTTINAGHSSATTFYLLNGMQRGDAINQRVGRTLRLKSVEIKSLHSLGAGATATSIRMILFLSLAPKGVAPVAGDVLNNGGPPLNIVSPRNLDNRANILILRDKTISLSVSGSQKQAWDYYKKLDIKPVYNSGNAGTIADIDAQGLYFMIMSTEPVNVPASQIFLRVRFIDN